MQIHKQIESLDEYEGTVPNLPEWSFSYHGIGLCLYGPNNECLDVDFHDKEAKTIDPFFFSSRVLSLEKTDLPEARLKHWLPKSQLIASAIKELQKKPFLNQNSLTPSVL